VLVGEGTCKITVDGEVHTSRNGVELGSQNGRLLLAGREYVVVGTGARASVLLH
jgi:hypothetical protein